MEQKNILSIQLTLEDIRDQFEKWCKSRKSRGDPLPEELWKVAPKLTSRYSINKISKVLRMNYTDLKNHVYGQSTSQSIKSENLEPIINS